MKYRIPTTLLLASLLIGGACEAAELEAIRATNDSEHTRIVLDMNDPASNWDVSSNQKKDELTLILPDTKNNMTSPISYESGRDGLLKGVRISTNAKGALVVTLKAKEPVQHNLFLLEEPSRMVIDIFTNHDKKKVKALNEHLTFFQWNRSIPSGRLQVYTGIDTDAESVSVYNDVSQVKITKDTELALPIYGVVSSIYNDYAPKAYLEGVKEGYNLIFKNPQYNAIIDKTVVPITAVNEKRRENALVLYTPRNGYTTNTNAYGAEALIVKNKVVSVGGFNTKIPEDGLVLSGHGQMEKLIKSLKVGMEVRIQEAPAHIQRKDEVLIQGIPVLENGKMIGSQRMYNDENRTGRSYLGVTAEGYIVAVLMRGGEGNSIGVTAKEGIEILKEMGVTSAIALNTGEYAAMYVDDHMIGKKMPWKKYKQVIVLQ